MSSGREASANPDRTSSIAQAASDDHRSPVGSRARFGSLLKLHHLISDGDVDAESGLVECHAQGFLLIRLAVDEERAPRRAARPREGREVVSVGVGAERAQHLDASTQVPKSSRGVAVPAIGVPGCAAP